MIARACSGHAVEAVVVGEHWVVVTARSGRSEPARVSSRGQLRWRVGVARERRGLAIFPFWDIVIAPLVATLTPERVVEIGALRGDTTTSLLDSLGETAQLHVIDPVPQFDPDEHARRFAGRYVFHRDLSLAVLPKLEPVDLALIDGDHNWYTVYNELRLLTAAAVKAGRLPPVFVLHDVSWPYGRRDGYYAPKQVPRRFRHPNAQLGLERGRSELCETGGVNRNIWNTRVEGGARNGVRTALEDFGCRASGGVPHRRGRAVRGAGGRGRGRAAPRPARRVGLSRPARDRRGAGADRRAGPSRWSREAIASGTMRLD